MTLAGCSLEEPIPSASGDFRPEREVVGRSTEGRPIELIVLGSPEAPVVLLFGVIHGNEPIGRDVLECLATDLRGQPDVLRRNRVVIVPVVNPDGLARGTRGNARGVDLNRNFPSRNWQAKSRHGEYPSSEEETRVLLKVLRQFRPERILSIHSPLDCINFDGPAATVAARFAALTGYPLKPYIGYPTPGSFGSYAGGDLAIPTLTIETASHDDVATGWTRLRPGLLDFIGTRSGERDLVAEATPADD